MILVLWQLRAGDALSFTRCAAVLRISAIVQLNTELFSGPVVERSGHGQIMVPFSSRGLRIARQSAHGNHKPYLCAIKIQKAIPMRQFSLVLLGCESVLLIPFAVDGASRRECARLDAPGVAEESGWSAGPSGLRE